MVSWMLLLCGLLLQGKPVPIASISAQGSRLPAEALIRLTELQPGQTIDEQGLRAACDKIAATGLVSDVRYEIKSKQVIFTMKDVEPLIPAKLDFPEGEQPVAWKWLKLHEPLIDGQLPRTKAAIGFYQKQIDAYLASINSGAVANAAVTADEAGKPYAVHFFVVQPANQKRLGHRDDGAPDFELETAVEPGKVISQVTPAYPPQAQQIRLQGVVKLDATINERGEVIECKVISGHPLLINAAIDALRQWRYAPKVVNGVPVESHTTADVKFQLNP